MNGIVSTDLTNISATLAEALELVRAATSEDLEREINERRRIRNRLSARYGAAHAALKLLEARSVEVAPFAQLRAAAMHDYAMALAEDAEAWAERAREYTRPKADPEEFGLSWEDLRLGLLINSAEKASPGEIKDRIWGLIVDFDCGWSWEDLLYEICSISAGTPKKEDRQSDRAEALPTFSSSREDAVDFFSLH